MDSLKKTKQKKQQAICWRTCLGLKAGTRSKQMFEYFPKANSHFHLSELRIDFCLQVMLGQPLTHTEKLFSIVLSPAAHSSVAAKHKLTIQLSIKTSVWILHVGRGWLVRHISILCWLFPFTTTQEIKRILSNFIRSSQLVTILRFLSKQKTLTLWNQLGSCKWPVPLHPRTVNSFAQCKTSELFCCSYFSNLSPLNQM